jgi:hypothetical protein
MRRRVAYERHHNYQCDRVFFDYVIVEEGGVGPVRVKVPMFLSVTLRAQG